MMNDLKKKKKERNTGTERGRKFWEAMDKFMALIIMMVSRAYLPPDTSNCIHQISTTFYMLILPQ